MKYDIHVGPIVYDRITTAIHNAWSNDKHYGYMFYERAMNFISFFVNEVILYKRTKDNFQEWKFEEEYHNEKKDPIE